MFELFFDLIYINYAQTITIKITKCLIFCFIFTSKVKRSQNNQLRKLLHQQKKRLLGTHHFTHIIKHYLHEIY